MGQAVTNRTYEPIYSTGEMRWWPACGYKPHLRTDIFDRRDAVMAGVRLQTAPTKRHMRPERCGDGRRAVANRTYETTHATREMRW